MDQRRGLISLNSGKLNLYSLYTGKLDLYSVYNVSWQTKPESEFNEFEPRLKSAKNRFQLSAGLNLETLNAILSEINHI